MCCRQSKEWWVHYTFAKPTAERQYYTVKITFQLRRVMVGTLDTGNDFRATWLQEWNSPVKAMHIVFAFPHGYKLTRFSVKPGTSLRGMFFFVALCTFLFFACPDHCCEAIWNVSTSPQHSLTVQSGDLLRHWEAFLPPFIYPLCERSVRCLNKLLEQF